MSVKVERNVIVDYALKCRFRTAETLCSIATEYDDRGLQCPKKLSICCGFCADVEHCCEKCPEVPLWDDEIV